MKKKNTIIIKYIFLLLIFQSYILGFFFRENLAGGAEQDFNSFTWPLILAFKENFLGTLRSYWSFGEGSTPMFHILNSYLNPFIYNQLAFQGSITLLSFLNVIFFSQIIKTKFKLNNLDSYLYASIFLILPFFRSSAYWGLTENLGWLFLILSIKYFIKYSDGKNKDNILNVFLICFFSSLALYTRPYLIFFPIFIILNSMLDKEYYLLKYSSFFYLLLSLPGFALLYVWGGSVHLGVGEDKINFIEEYHHPKFILKNLVVFVSIFLFYLIPIEISNFSKKINLSTKSMIIFLSILCILLILNFFNIFEYLNEIRLGGGAILKLNKIIFNDRLFFFLLFVSIGLLVLFDYFTLSKKNKIILFSLLIFCQPRFILQEYFEPLILILLFTLFDLKEKISDKIKDNKTIMIFSTYFLIYFLSSCYYRYFYIFT